MQPDPSWTDTAQTVVIAAQLAVLVVAAIYAGKQVREARQLREEQARPFVVIDFDVKDHLIYIVVSNIGNTLATDVRFGVEPAFESTIAGYQAKDLKIFRTGISTLAPGKVIRTLFDTFPKRESTGLADSYAIQVSYSDEKRRRTFEERIDLDIGLYRNLLSVTRQDIHHVNETLGKILREMKQWRGSANRGLLTMSPKEKRAEGRRLRRELEGAWWKRPNGTWRKRMASLIGALPPRRCG